MDGFYVWHYLAVTPRRLGVTKNANSQDKLNHNGITLTVNYYDLSYLLQVLLLCIHHMALQI